jgi:hypothetical protein
VPARQVVRVAGQHGAHGFRLEVGQAVDRDLAVLVGEQDGGADVLGRVRTWTPAWSTSGRPPESGRRVVVAARDDDPRAGVAEPEQRVVVEATASTDGTARS